MRLSLQLVSISFFLKIYVFILESAGEREQQSEGVSGRLPVERGGLSWGSIPRPVRSHRN